MKTNLFNIFPFFKKESKPTIEPAILPPNETPRQHFRMNLSAPLIAQLNILKINGKPVQTKYTNVLIEDIGPGGLRFLSELDFPLIHDITLLFETVILGETLQVNGLIRWKEQDGMLTCYGIELDLEEPNRKELTQALNRFMISLKNEGIYPKSDLYKEETTCFFKTRQRKK